MTDNHGFTLYLYSPDKGNGTPTCTAGECASEWPAVTTTSAPVAGAGLTGKLATAKLADGRQQVTLNGWPLYYFAGDTGPGEHNGLGKFGVCGRSRPPEPRSKADQAAVAGGRAGPSPLRPRRR